MTRLIRAEVVKLRSIRTYRLLALGALALIAAGVTSTSLTASHTGGAGQHAQVVAPGAAGMDRARVEQRADRAEWIGQLGVPAASDQRPASIGPDQPEQCPQRRGLARPVGPEEPGDAAVGDGEGKVPDGHGRPEPLAEPGHVDGRRCRGRPVPCGSGARAWLQAGFVWCDHAATVAVRGTPARRPGGQTRTLPR